MSDSAGSAKPAVVNGDRLMAEGEGRIRPRARILRTIGAELISSEIVALIELVRNSYDADATEVRIVFENPEDTENATISVVDDGHGMTREVLLGPWLEPATDHKHGNEKSSTGGERSPKGRRRLGSKGVGRFAAQRLGDYLELRTKAADAERELVANFDWLSLERGDYLDEVRVPWREVVPETIEDHGTHLYINGLKDRWTPERFEKLRLGLSRLVSPTIERDFKISMEVNGAVEKVEPAVDAKTPMYSIEGEVKEGGEASITYRDLENVEEWERHVLWPEDADQKCGPFSFRINVWDLDSEALRHYLNVTESNLGLRDFRKAVRGHAGISLYRDGFRILPYGEPDNDWLELDRRRANNPNMRLSNNQIVGTIHLSADLNPDLKDQTNREGLVTNQAYDHLREVVLELLSYLEARRFASRREMDFDWQQRSSSLPSVDEENQGDRVTEILEELKNSGADGDELIDELREAFDEHRSATADAIQHYAGLATAGQLSEIIFGQIQHPIRQIRSDLTLALDELDGDPTHENLADASENVQRSIQHLDTIEKRMEKLDPLAIGGRGRRTTVVTLDEVLEEVLDAYRDEFFRQGVALDFRGREETSVETNREIVQQALANLLNNALYWSQQSEAETPTVTVEVVEDGFHVGDNGPGIEEDLKETVFEPHFSTRDDGHGLGLTLVKDLLKTVGAKIRLENCRPATFSVQFRR